MEKVNKMSINGVEIEIVNADIIRKINGYGFDSLCLRYNMARDAQAEWEISHKGAVPESAYKLAKRDKLRFYEILDDLIGEHD